MEPKTKQRIIYFTLALALYGMVAGSDLSAVLIRKLTLYYLGAAVFTFWLGGDPVGTFRPISMRPLCLLLGSIVMVCLFIMMLFVKEALHHQGRAPGSENFFRAL